jgi:hypothetical protein
MYDPRRNDIISAAIEASGVLRSENGGDSWVQLPAPAPCIQNINIHGIVAHPSGKRLASTPNGVWTSSEEGQTYTLHRFPIEWPPEPAAVAVQVETYSRGMAVKTDDPDTVKIGQELDGIILRVPETQWSAKAVLCHKMIVRFSRNPVVVVQASKSGSQDCVPSIDQQVGPADPCGFVRGEEHRIIGYVVWLAHPAEHEKIAGNPPIFIGIEQKGGLWRGDRAR